MKSHLDYHIKKYINYFLRKYQAFIASILRYFLNKDLKKIILRNRKYLKNTTSFLSENEFNNNDYGMDRKIFTNLDKEIKKYPTYTDLLIFASTFLNNKKVNYLEIGVSVLKNFMQIDNYIENSNLVAFDINPIVPKYKKKFSLIKEENKESKIYSAETKNNLFYFEGSILNNRDIEHFNNFFDMKFNIIFSDALHTPEGIWSEYENIISKKIDKEFILYFDDLDFPGLEETAIKVFNDMKEKNGKLYFTTFKVYGWVGQHEKMHKNGIISNINFYDIFRSNKIFLPSLKLMKG